MLQSTALLIHNATRSRIVVDSTAVDPLGYGCFVDSCGCRSTNDSRGFSAGDSLNRVRGRHCG